MDTTTATLILMCFGILNLCLGYWMGRNSAGLPISSEEPKPTKQEKPTKPYVYADEDIYTKAMQEPVKTDKVFGEERIVTMPEDK